ncbi:MULTISPECIES: hypothetical protein [Halorussus]|uniref:hypothetical protein n=1 Tax=Halorussus TaxID=1070314 RepID=UPI000E216FF3|nr:MULTISPECIES: hypothetical protein [Halorussus]NHN61127.1 hypothetical protein [Halorussus sp. JP-T4]
MILTLRVGVRQLRRAAGIRELQVGFGILLFGGGVVAAFLLAFPQLTPSTALQLVTTFVAAVAGVYLSHTLVVHRIFKTDRDRIDAPEAVCERYADAVELLELSGLESLNPAYAGELPLVVHDSDVFEGPDPSFPTERSDSVYQLPASVSAFLEPRRDDLVARFNSEGKHNRRLVRVDAIRGSTVRVSESSYFRTYCTNISPDFTGRSDRKSLRDAFDPELVTERGIVPLSESPFSNTLSGGGLVVTTDGATILGLKALDATVGERELADSFGGNVEFQRFGDASVRDELVREATEEVASVTERDVRVLYGLGLVRRLDWLGQPNLHSLLLVDAPAELVHSGTEHLHTISVDLGEDVTVDEASLSDPDFAREFVSEILDACESSRYTPGVTLLTTLELWLRQAGATKERLQPDRSRTPEKRK